MNTPTLLGLVLTGWLAQQTPPASPSSAPPSVAQKPVSTNLKVRIATSTYLADGRVLSAAASDWPLTLNQPVVVYATSGQSLCDSRPATVERPADAGYGWRVQFTPVRETATELELRVEWRQMQMWNVGPVTPVPTALVLTLHPGDRLVVDYLPGSTLRFFKTRAAADAEFQRLRVTTTGCNAVGMGLEIGLEPAKSLPVVEAELWLVRPNQDGTERSDRQVVRLPLGQPATSYFFDEESLMTPRPVTIAIPAAKVSGELSAFSVEGGKIHLNFSVSRRYEGVLTIDPGSERSTNATYRDLVATPGEVLAFQLPTVEMPVIETTFTGGSPTYTVTSRRLPQLSVRLRAQIVR
jgi:hypothetical protein